MRVGWISLVAGIGVTLAAGACEQFQKVKQDLSDSMAKLQNRVAQATGNAPFGTWGPMDADAGAPAQVACTIPIHDDDYYGFAIGYPAGWRIDYSTGTIMVTKDEKNLEGAIVFPARLRKADVTADQVANVFVRGLARTITAKGGTFQMTEQKTNGKIASAVILANVGGVDLKGPLLVVENPGFVTVKLYWAPQTEFAADEPTLQQVVGCFQRHTLIRSKAPVKPPGGPVTKVGVPGNASTATTAIALGPVQLLHPYRGKFYNASLPAGWKPTDEAPTGLDTISGDGHSSAGLGYQIAYRGTPQQLAQGLASQYWPGTRIQRAEPLQDAQGWSTFEVEFEGLVRGAPIHGITRGSVNRGGTAITMAMISTIDGWPAMKSTLHAIEASIQVTPAAVAGVAQEYRADLARFAPPPMTSSSPTASPSTSGDSSMASWEQDQAAKDKTNQDFDDAIRGQDRAVSPTTGETYICPNNLWSADGPQGAGYYRALPGGGSELLQTPAPDAPAE